MKRISILGCGWLGLPLAQYFVSLGYKVNASIRSENKVKKIESIGAFPFIVDIDNLGVNKIKPFLDVDILIVNIPSKNIEGFRTLIDEIEKSKIKRVLFVSSTSVYKNTNSIIFESDLDSYSQSPLLEIEKAFLQSESFKTTIIRFGGLIGYNRQPGRFFKGGRVVSAPEAPVNLIHRDDCIGIINEIVKNDIFGEIFNCCADTHPTKKDFYSYAATSIACPPPEFEKPGESSNKIISNQKVKKLLNYNFKHPDLMKINFKEN